MPDLPGALLTSGGPPKLGMETELGPIMELDFQPMQTPGNPPCVGEQLVGGPATGLDVRMYLDREPVERLLALARVSVMLQVELRHVGIRKRVFQAPCGGVYACLDLVSDPPRAEGEGGLLPLLGTRPEVYDPARVFRLGAVDRAPSRLLSEVLVGGPESRRDYRVYIESVVLARFAEACQASVNGLAVLHGAGVRVRVFQEEQRSHKFAVLSFVHLPAEAAEPVQRADG